MDCKISLCWYFRDFYPYTKLAPKSYPPSEMWSKNEIQYGGRCRPEFTSVEVLATWYASVGLYLSYSVSTIFQYSGRLPYSYYTFEFLTTHLLGGSWTWRGDCPISVRKQFFTESLRSAFHRTYFLFYYCCLSFGERRFFVSSRTHLFT